MTLHIDLYAVHVVTGYNGSEPRRQFEGQEAIDYATTGPGATKGLPHWNGYSLQTALHDDGECEAHRPQEWSEDDMRRRPVKKARP